MAAESVPVAIIGGCFAMIGVIVPILDNWRQKRDSEQVASAKVELSSKKAEFWKVWLEVASQLESEPDLANAKQLVAGELIKLAFLYSEKSTDEALDALSQKQKVTTIRQILLLYKPSKWIGWPPRILFYGFFSYLTYVLAIFPYSQIFKGVDILIYFLLLTTAVLVWLFWYLSIKIGD